MFIVTEVQITKEGQTSALNTPYEDANQAQSKYHTVLAAAAISNVYKHAAFLYTEDGFIAHDCFTHDEAGVEE